MKIYVTHSSSYDYTNELYIPLRNSNLNTKHDIILPHELNETVINSKKYIKESNLVLAEVSYPSTGQGIELGWADDAGIPIIYFFKEGFKISNSLNVLSLTFVQYTSTKELIEKLNSEILKAS